MRKEFPDDLVRSDAAEVNETSAFVVGTLRRGLFCRGMSEEPNAGTSELQKLLDEGVASVALGTAAGRQKAPILIDITKEFLAECSSLYFLSLFLLVIF